MAGQTVSYGDTRRVWLYDELRRWGWEGECLRCQLVLLLSTAGHIHCPGGDPGQQLLLMLPAGMPADMVEIGLQQLLEADWIQWQSKARLLTSSTYSDGQDPKVSPASNRARNRRKRALVRDRAALKSAMLAEVEVIYHSIAGAVVPPLSDTPRVGRATRHGSVTRHGSAERHATGRPSDTPRVGSDTPRVGSDTPRVAVGGRGVRGVRGLGYSRSKPLPQTPSSAPVEYSSAIWRAWLTAKRLDIATECARHERRLIAKWYLTGVAVSMFEALLGEETGRLPDIGAIGYFSKPLSRLVTARESPDWQVPPRDESRSRESLDRVLDLLILRAGEIAPDSVAEFQALRGLSTHEIRERVNALDCHEMSLAIAAFFEDLEQLEGSDAKVATG